MYDLAVIGGGPVGAVLANSTASRGHRVLLIEEHSSPGSPIQCAGLVSERIRNISSFPEECIINTVTGARILGPAKEEICLRSRSQRTLVIDRKHFDRILWESAAASGAEALCSSRVSGVAQHKGKCVIEHVEGVSEADYVAGCDGPASIVRRSMGLQPSKMLSGVGAEVCLSSHIQDDEVIIRCGHRIAPGFFAWVIPLCDKRARIGLAVDPAYSQQPARKYLEKIVRKPEVLGLSGAMDVLEWNGGVIPIGHPGRTATERMLLAGDSACQVKATSGGGLVMGLKGAKHASETIHKAISDEDKLFSYDRTWKRDMGGDLRRARVLHEHYVSLDDRKLSQMFEKLQKSNVVEMVNSKGDIDYPSKLVLPSVLRSPSLIIDATPLALRYVLSFISHRRD